MPGQGRDEQREEQGPGAGRARGQRRRQPERCQQVQEPQRGQAGAEEEPLLQEHVQRPGQVQVQVLISGEVDNTPGTQAQPEI